MEKPNFNTQEYRDNLAKDLKEIRKDDTEKAHEVLDIIKTTTNYKEAEEANVNRIVTDKIAKEAKKEKDNFISYEKSLEEEIYKFEHGKFNVVEVGQSNKEILDKALEIGMPVQEDVFVAMSGGSNNYELLKAIDSELKDADQKRLEVFFVNEFVDIEGKGSIQNTLGVPFSGMFAYVKDKEAAGLTSYTSVEDILTQLEKGKIDKSSELGANYCDLVKEWAEYYQSHFSDTGFKEKRYTTYSEGNDLTMHHVDLESDSELLKNLFINFLKEKGVDLKLTTVSKEGSLSKFGDFRDTVPLATGAYHILIEKMGEAFNKNFKDFYRIKDEEFNLNHKVDKIDYTKLDMNDPETHKLLHNRPHSLGKNLGNRYAVSVAKEIISRQSLKDKKYTFSNRWDNK
jgi:hypothetical protein